MLDNIRGLAAASSAAAVLAIALAPAAQANTQSCGVKKLGGGTKARVYVDKGSASCRLATSTLRHADITKVRKGWTCYRGNGRVDQTAAGIGCDRKKGRDVISAVYVQD